MALSLILMNKERKEAFLRIPIGILSGIILHIWRMLIIFLALVNLVYTIFDGKRHKGIAEFSEYWNTEMYKFSRYLTFVSNERPFPFTDLARFSKFK
jgi:hypothetical protein